MDGNDFDHNSSQHDLSTPRTQSYILARISELRPVLPRPAMNKDGGSTGPLHTPSTGVAHGHLGRHHHDSMFFSPYGRAYDYVHGSHEQPLNNEVLVQQVYRPSDLPDPSPPKQQSYSDQLLQIASSWLPTNAQTSFPSVHGCEDGSPCPSCVQRNVSTISSSPHFQSCPNPGTCTSCLDCSILSVPDFLPPDTDMSIYNSQSIDDWLRQVSALPMTCASATLAPALHQPTSEAMDHGPSPWNTFQMPRISQPDSDGDGCGGQCACPPGLCRCNYRVDRDRTKSGVTSGERLSPCFGKMDGQAADGRNALRSDVNPTANRRSHCVTDQSSVRLDGDGFLTVPQMARSRSSSASSQSSTGEAPNRSPAGQCDPSRITQQQATMTMTTISRTPLSFPVRSSKCLSIVEPNSDVAYARSNPDSDLSLDDGYSPYNPSLDGIRLY